MKLARFAVDGVTTFGVIEEDGTMIRDLAPDMPGVADLEALIRISGGRLDAFVRRIAKRTGSVRPLASVRLLAPIVRPDKFLAIGGNYASHRAESAAAAEAENAGQIWFNKQIGCINDPFGDIWKPGGSDQLDYEGELAVIIGRRCRDVGQADALDHVAAYCVCNDVSVRDWQAKAPTATLGKSFDTHGPIGPWLTTRDEAGNAPDLLLRTWVNGVLRQEARTSDMVASVADMIVELSAKCTLEPGDILATGTPAGIGKAMSPPGYMKPGDVVRVEIERLGAIENRVISSPPRGARV